MQMREAAERVLFGVTLDEKLSLAPAAASDDAPGTAIAVPDAPGRPEELRIGVKGGRAGFPGINKLDDERERGRMLHFLANHELLAAELMALVLLRFPEAPHEYRAGVYEAMREEQMHARMYLRRMNECGVHFGELPLNDYFWRLVAPMETPMDFVTRLNLTFEQANLDFSKHYAGLFRQVGDGATAAVLDKIYHDEIGHVGHGVRWFRKWKKQGETDWKAFNQSLVFPFSAARAKGLAPFNAEGRREAGLDEDFIRELEVCEQSRGRTPVVHWFNPNAELETAARRRGQPFHPRKAHLAMEHDAELVTLALSRRDDLVLVREMPSQAHLAYLQRAGFQLPEFGDIDSVGQRKLGGLRPWAWSQDASDFLASLRDSVPASIPWQWREALPEAWLSKAIGIELMARLGIEERGVACTDRETALQQLDALLENGTALIKGCHGCAGRDQLKVDAPEREKIDEWLESALTRHGSVVIEPWRDRIADFSALYEMDAAGARLLGMSVMENDARGGFVASRVAPKWASLLEREVAEFLFREGAVMDWYQERIPALLAELLPGYIGPLGIDAMVFRKPDGHLDWTPVVELNVRTTMGRVALELLAKSRPGAIGELCFHRKEDLGADEVENMASGSLEGGSVLLTDPAKADAFLVQWSVQLATT
ncbi:MAG: DUF455 family protein [Verrucomicrobiota bacterium]